jgi:hypothetical protein
MIPAVPRHKVPRTWVWAWAAAALALLLVLALLKIAPPEALTIPENHATAPFISLQKQDGVADMAMDQALLLDSAPLFLPTRWSTARSYGAASSPSLTDPFEFFGAKISVSEASLHPPAVPVATALPGILPARGAMGEFSALGRDDGVLSGMVLPARGACYEVRRAGDDALVLERTIAQAIPDAGDLLWQPAEFWVHVTAEGPQGSPLIASGTGSDSLDAALRNLVVEGGAIDLLPPGYYRIVVGP